MTQTSRLPSEATPQQLKRAPIIHGLQILRGIAALLVLARHSAKAVSTTPSSAFEVGQAGVDVFFVISGVVIYLTARRQSWHLFFRRRIARIVPLYWLALILTILGDVARQMNQEPGWLANALLSFMFIPAYNPQGGIFPPLVVGWTLNFEMWFYVMCGAALLLGAGARLHIALTGMLLLAVMIGLVFLSGNEWTPTPATVPLLPITLEFLAGLWLAKFWISGHRATPAQAAALVAASVLWLVLAPAAAPLTVSRPLNWGVPAVAITWAVMSMEEHLPFIRMKAALLLGNASYALYLVHPIVIGIEMLCIARFAPGLPAGVTLIVLLISAIVAGILTHLIVERRLLLMANRLLGLRRGAIRSEVAFASSGDAPDHR